MPSPVVNAHRLAYMSPHQATRGLEIMSLLRGISCGVVYELDLVLKSEKQIL